MLQNYISNQVPMKKNNSNRNENNSFVRKLRNAAQWCHVSRRQLGASGKHMKEIQSKTHCTWQRRISSIRNAHERVGRDETPATADKGEQFAKLHKSEIRNRIEVNFQHLVLITPDSRDQPWRYAPSEHFNFYKQPIYLLLSWPLWGIGRAKTSTHSLRNNPWVLIYSFTSHCKNPQSQRRAKRHLNTMCHWI